MLLGPVTDQRQVGAERLGDDVVGIADVERTVANAREARDVLDHLRVVVRGQELLALPAVGHWEPAHEVGQPHVRGLLLLGILVQVVVELPGLVPDPEVVLVVADDVVEDHEVREQDLVHAADRLEAVQVVLGALALDVAGLVREERASGMDALAALLEHPRHRMLGQPVDLEVGMELAQLVGDRRVALRVAEPDRRRDVEGALAPRLAAHPLTRRRRRRDEVPEQQVDLHRITSLRKVARSPERDELAARRRCESDSLRLRPDRVRVAVHDEHRAADARTEIGERDTGRQADPRVVVGERLGRGLEGPRDPVLDRLRRVRLREALPQEELEEVVVVAQPVVDVVLRPPFVGVERLVEGVHPALGQLRRQRNRRADERGAGDALRVLGSEQDAPQRGARDADHDCALGRGRIEHSECVERELADRVRLRAHGPVGAAVAAPVERDDPAVAREVRDLHLPVPRVDERPGRQQEDGRLARAVDLVVELHAVAFDVA